MMWEKTYDPATYDDAAEYIVTTPDCGFAVFTDSAKLPGTPGEFDGGYGLYRTAPEIDEASCAAVSE